MKQHTHAEAPQNQRLSGLQSGPPLFVAIYPRYSSENQRPESIEDQVSACCRLARDRDYVIDDRHVYADRAASGACRDRHGLNGMLAALDRREFDLVIVDDLSRLEKGGDGIVLGPSELQHDTRNREQV